jgi:Lar family restriction alleviation protein
MTKPCPFCGGEAEIASIEHEPRLVDDLTTKFFYTCRSCACAGPWTRSETAALKSWNMRVDATDLLAAAHRKLGYLLRDYPADKETRELLVKIAEAIGLGPHD